MKTLGLSKMLASFFLIIGSAAAYGQGQLEVPGDNFSLEGALELFKKSASPEEFERLLNSADSKVNNLDLNGDGNIDYIRVVDRTEGNVHAFILQAIVSESETQDVAVIELEKLADGKAVLQITGDEDVYGVETIIEPTREVRVNAGTSTARTVVNVWAWPSVQYIYGPYYSVWVSPWRWSYRPYWWRPWSPYAYYDYYSWWRPYRPYYSVCYSHRVYYAQHLYRPYRTTSVIVHNRHHTQIAHYRSTRNDYSGRNRYDDGRNRYNGGASNGRLNNSANRYDANGRLTSSSGQRTTSRSSTSTWSQVQGKDGYNGGSSAKRNDLSSADRSTSSSRSAANVSPRSYGGLLESSDIRRSTAGSSFQRSTGSSNVQRSTGSSNVQRSTGSSNVQRSTGSSNIQRSSGSSNVQRSTGSSNIQRSSGSSNVQRSSGISNIQRSSGSSNIQRSSGSSNFQRSSGSSNIQRPSGGSSIQRSSGGSSIQRSSGGSSAQRSGNSGGGKSSGGQHSGRR